MQFRYRRIPYFSAHCISDHRISKPNPNPNSNPNPNHNPNPNPNPNPDNSPDHDCSHLLVRDAVVRNAVGRKGGHRTGVVWKESGANRLGMGTRWCWETSSFSWLY